MLGECEGMAYHQHDVGGRDIPLEDEKAFIPSISLRVPEDSHGSFFDFGVAGYQLCYQGDMNIHSRSEFDMRD
jgi:hypothetical protein